MTAALAAVAVFVLGRRLRIRTHRRVATDGPRAGGRVARRGAVVVVALRARSYRRSPVTPLAAAEWCSGLSRAIGSGDSLRFALERHVPVDEAVRRATEPLRLALQRGRTVADAADHASTDGRRGGHHVALACDVLATCDRVGGSAAGPLERVAAALRSRAADEQERAAQSAQARLSAHAMTVVPLAVLGLFAATDAAIRTAVATPAGALCVAAGVSLNGAGWAWMRRIIHGVDRC